MKDLENLSEVKSIYNTKMNPKEEKLALSQFKKWVTKYAK